MAFWSPENLAALAGGVWYRDVTPPPEVQVTGVGIDTRTLAPGQVYVAIRGENHDGHDYVVPALERGAAFALVEDSVYSDGHHLPGAVLFVESTVDAMQAWARAYRDELAAGGCKVIAVAGSNGKTTTRHLIHHVLTNGGLTGTQSPKSFNNHLGVPLTLLAAQPGHNFVACEVGTNHPGEIAALSAIVRPDVAVITCIGSEHLEFFGDLEGVTKEEAAILPFVEPGGAVFVHHDAAEMLAPHYDVQENVALFPLTPEQFADAVPDDLPLPGAHNRTNAQLAAVVGRWFGLPDEPIRRALAAASLPDGRMQVLAFGDVTVVHDAYNANPDSTKAVMDWLCESDLAKGRPVMLVFGEMLELGHTSEEAHRALGEDLTESGGRFNPVVLIGPGAVVVETEARRHSASAGLTIVHRDQLDDAYICEIVDSIKPGDTVLLKGSRAFQMERILPAIEKRFGPPQ